MLFSPTIPEAFAMYHGVIVQTILRGKFGWVAIGLVALGLFWVGWRSYISNPRV